MTNIYLLISLGFLAGSIITGTILWLRLSGKLRSALDKSIRLEAESNLRINIKEELKKELSSATEDAISPIKNYVIKEIGNAETVRSDAKLKLEELNAKQNDTVNTIVSRFEQINIKKEIVGEKGRLLTENLEVSISFYNESPLTVELPNQVTCTIETTDVALKGQTVSSSYKPATLDNGINIQVPPFIDSGDKIIVDTRTMEYIKKI